MDPTLLGHDIAYPAMLKFLPVGFVGLMVGGLIAAHSSTTLTHLNWGASYLVHDFYRRFIRRDASERHYVWAGRWATILIFLCSSGLVYLLETAKDNFDIILQIGAGTGLLYLLRWFWWRITAWCEVAAMVSSFGFSVVLLVLRKQAHLQLSTHHALLLTVAVTTLSWLLVAYFGPQTDRGVLVKFWEKVRPFGPGWKPIRAAAGVAPEPAGGHENVPLALLGWTTGWVAIWGALFVIGSFLYGRMVQAGVLSLVVLVSGFVLLRVVSTLWKGSEKH
jgi:Na+/proline symporter